MRNLFVGRIAVLLSAMAAVLSLPFSACALNIVSGPTFTNSTLAPLAGTLRVNTDVPSRVSIFVDDGTTTWMRDFYDYTNNHTITLLGFKAGRTNEVTVTISDRWRNTVT